MQKDEKQTRRVYIEHGQQFYVSASVFPPQGRETDLKVTTESSILSPLVSLVYDFCVCEWNTE